MDEIRLGSRTLQPRRQLLAHGRREPLGKRALDILTVLAEARGGIVTKTELFEAVWPGVIIEENALQVHIVALRKALGAEADRLRTIRGIGYQLEIDPTATQAPGGVPGGASPSPDGAAAAVPTIVVLPFDNMSADPDQDYFADGITEDIITDLSHVSALKVIARNSAFAFRGRHTDTREVARQLRASHIVQGSVRRSGDRLRVSAQLIDGHTGEHIWAQRYDEAMADIFDLQDKLAFAIVHALKVNLLPSEQSGIGARGTNNAQAYDLYVRARALRATMQHENVLRAPALYRQALQLDPGFAVAWAGLASSLHQNLTYLSDTTIDFQEIDEALARALELAPGMPAIIASKAQRCLSALDWQGAEDCISAFREQNDSSWSVCSHLLLMLGRPNEAANHQLEVWRSDPLSPGAVWNLQLHLDYAGRLQEADAEFERSRDLPGGRGALDWAAVTRMMALRKHDKVRERYAASQDRDDGEMRFRTKMMRWLDDPKKALEFVRKTDATLSGERYFDLERIAHWAAYLGDDALALSAIRRCATHGYALMLSWHPNFTSLRKTSTFKDLLRDIGLVDYWRRSGNWGEVARPLGPNDFELLA